MYYILTNNEPEGPYDEGEFIEKLKFGGLPENSYCWKEGWQEWRNAQSVFSIHQTTSELSLIHKNRHEVGIKISNRNDAKNNITNKIKTQQPDSLITRGNTFKEFLAYYKEDSLGNTILIILLVGVIPALFSWPGLIFERCFIEDNIGKYSKGLFGVFESILNPVVLIVSSVFWISIIYATLVLSRKSLEKNKGKVTKTWKMNKPEIKIITPHEQKSFIGFLFFFFGNALSISLWIVTIVIFLFLAHNMYFE